MTQAATVIKLIETYESLLTKIEIVGWSQKTLGWNDSLSLKYLASTASQLIHLFRFS